SRRERTATIEAARAGSVHVVWLARRHQADGDAGTMTTNGPSSGRVVADNTQDEEMAVRRERAVAHNPGKDLEGQGFTPLANIGCSLGDLADEANDSRPDRMDVNGLIARP